MEHRGPIELMYHPSNMKIGLCWYQKGPDNKDASTIKYTTPLPCIGLRESDSKLCTNFEFCKGKNS